MTSVFQAEHRTMTAFILAVIVNSYNTGQVSVALLPHPCRACLWVADAQLQALGFGGQRNCPECVSDETVTSEAGERFGITPALGAPWEEWGSRPFV